MDLSRLGQSGEAQVVCGIGCRSWASSQGSPFSTASDILVSLKHDGVYARLQMYKVERSCGLSKCTDVE